MKNLIMRTLTGVVFVALMVGSILYGPISFGILFALVTGMSMWEYTGLINQREDVSLNRLISVVAAVYLFCAFWGYSSGVTPTSGVFIPYVLTLLYLMVSELYQERSHTLNNWAYTMFGQIYVALPFSLLSTLAFTVNPADMTVNYSWIFPLMLYVLLWCSDTGAYCVGSLLGKKISYKLFPSVSPHKSWVGSVGGGLLAVAVAVLVSQWDSTLTPWEWVGFALVVVVFGTWGDLVESLFKRQLNIKDSGNILPGHGGMLDRFDSSMMAIPAVVVYLYTLLLL
jgi:phosphatidate cytidylyltransferase